MVRWSEGVVRLLCFVCFERFYMYLTYLTLPSPPSSYPRPEKKIEMFLPIYCNTWNFSLSGVSLLTFCIFFSFSCSIIVRSNRGILGRNIRFEKQTSIYFIS